jgi:hydrogenase-4 component B
MRACLLALALVCVALGVGGPWVTPWVAQVAGSLAPGLQLATAGGLVVFPGQGQWATYAPLVVGAALLVLMGVPWLLSVALGGYRAGKRTGVQPWASGYGYAPVMSANASSFHPALLAAFQPLYGLRRLVDRPFAWIAAWARRTNTDLAHSEPLIENSLTRPTLRFFEAAGHRIQALQMGDIRVYCFYIILTLAILLVWTMLR